MKKLYSILMIAMLVLVVGVLLFGCRSKEVESALIYINQQNDWEKAMEQLHLAVQVNPADVEAHVWLAKGYGHYGEFDKMVKEIDTVEKLMQGAPKPKFQQEIDFLRDKYWRISFNKGVANAKHDSLEAAKKNFEDCIMIDPKRPESYKNLAYVNNQMGDLEAAIKSYQSAVKINPRDIETLSFITNLYINTKQYEKVIETCDKILVIDPENANAVATKAMAYDFMGETDLAFEAYEEALKKDPNNKDLIFNLGRLYYGKQDYENAIKQFEKVLEMSSDDYEANINVGNAYLLLADNILKKYRDMDEKELQKHQKEFKADKVKSKEFYKKSIPYLEKAVVLSPDKYDGWYNLAVAYVQAGETKKGEKCFKISDEVKENDFLNASEFIDEYLSHLK